ncbi:shikimate dehydrogenase [Truepera radiovictrix]|uniref:Shikimate dehydrogenase (NADP(+)) n=1 Tax=Truepera radiovictrix (strain DSM 17093 / CIP 108686 / LMG 22925 / RQ-24) TaxID=649638 RepID=D7CSB4_TRURR|nr:shikimate dehydrogenase [Truepera radiovictrix]ADI13646.1 shikimate 5-dehydrogenase [Truepera radiovictrix DSM 17093]WMT57793.1 shikimate dehydrogenase [Truepera radiovictrix]
MKRAFLLAGSASYTLSPAMHNAAFRALGARAHYEALALAAAELPEAVARLRDPGCLGANVTIPHKLAVVPLLDTLSEAARATGAVNTIVNRGGALEGHNTDAAGFMRALKEDGGYDPAGQEVVLLGAGGSARAVAYALLRSGVARLAVYNRTLERAHALARALGPYGELEVLSPAQLKGRVRSAALLVNTTSVGLSGVQEGASPLPEDALPRAMVCDIIYRPPQTTLLKRASAAGLAVQNGLPMLVYQGAEALTLWTGLPAPVAVMRAAAEAALAA